MDFSLAKDFSFAKDRVEMPAVYSYLPSSSPEQSPSPTRTLPRPALSPLQMQDQSRVNVAKVPVSSRKHLDKRPPPSRTPRFPVEIISMILTELLVDEDQILIDPSAYSGKQEHKETLQCLLVCRLFYDVGVEIFYRHNDFNIHFGYKAITRFLKGIGPRRRKFLSSVTINDLSPTSKGYATADRDARAAYTLLKQCPLKKLLIWANELVLRDVKPELEDDWEAGRDSRWWQKSRYESGFSTAVVRARPERDYTGGELTPYERVKNLKKELPGIAVVKELRGLEEVSVGDINLLDANMEDGNDYGEVNDGELMPENHRFESWLQRTLTQPKPKPKPKRSSAATGEEEDEEDNAVPAKRERRS